MSMGIRTAFSPFAADFSNMSNTNLYVSKIKQKAKLEVNEDGAKASAVTITEMRYTSMGDLQEYQKSEFHATRPFLYFILEESTHSVFFIGTYCGN